MKLGFIVNPIAGMGGKVGLKGTDGEEVLEKALELGDKPEAPIKAKKALEVLVPVKDKLEIYTYPNNMGEDIARELGFEVKVLGERKAKTSSEDTEKAVSEMLDKNVELILFAGGDGTARNIYNAVKNHIPVFSLQQVFQLQVYGS